MRTDAVLEMGPTLAQTRPSAPKEIVTKQEGSYLLADLIATVEDNLFVLNVDEAETTLSGKILGCAFDDSSVLSDILRRMLVGRIIPATRIPIWLSAEEHFESDSQGTISLSRLVDRLTQKDNYLEHRY